MATPAQIAANRRNAQRSIGPKTAQGKQNSSKNAVKHGILALLPPETEGLQELLVSLYESLRPQDELQRVLVEQIAHAMLRLQRAAAFEEKFIKQGRPAYLPPGFVYVGDGGKPPELPVTMAPVARVTDLLLSPPGHVLLRYENTANRQIKRNLEMLLRLKAASHRLAQDACPYLTEMEGDAPSAPPSTPLPSRPEDARPQAIQPCVSHARQQGTSAPQPGSPGLPAVQPGPSGPGDLTGKWDTELASFRKNEVYNHTEKNGG